MTTEIANLKRRLREANARSNGQRAQYEERDAYLCRRLTEREGQLERSLERQWVMETLLGGEVPLSSSDEEEEENTQKAPMPTHISSQVWTLNEPDCQICLMPTTEETFALSKCGHNFCDKCFTDARVSDCGVCRQRL
jgi:hypothetical protein